MAVRRSSTWLASAAARSAFSSGTSASPLPRRRAVRSAPVGPHGLRRRQKFFARPSVASVRGLETLRARHLESVRSRRPHPRPVYFTVLVKMVRVPSAGRRPTAWVALVRTVIGTFVTSARSRFSSPSPPAYSPFVARQLRDAARSNVSPVLRRLQQVRSLVPGCPSVWDGNSELVIEERGFLPRDHPRTECLFRVGPRRISSLTNSTVVFTSRATISCRFLSLLAPGDWPGNRVRGA